MGNQNTILNNRMSVVRNRTGSAMLVNTARETEMFWANVSELI